MYTRSEALAEVLAPVNCSRGAPMGRLDRQPEEGERLWLARVPFIDGCYDRGGAYWGAPANLWVAFGPSGSRLFVRAADRKYAQMILREHHAGLKFYREQ